MRLNNFYFSSLQRKLKTLSNIRERQLLTVLMYLLICNLKENFCDKNLSYQKINVTNGITDVILFSSQTTHRR